jgi:hypothetical protein
MFGAVHMVNSFHRGAYLEFRLEKLLRIASCSNGKGVISSEDIQAGDMILFLGGPIFSENEIPFLAEPTNDYFLQIDEDLYLGPSGEVDDYINHSCNPNTGLVFSENRLGMKAIDFIPKGSEITYDYSTTMHGSWGTMTCNCGAPNCRKKIINFIEIPVSIQQRYLELGIVPDYIRHHCTQPIAQRAFSETLRPAISCARGRAMRRSACRLRRP